MKVDLHLLWQAAKNASLFSRQKTWNRGDVQFSFGEDYLSVAASDDFIGVVTTIPVERDTEKVDSKFYLAPADIKELEKRLRPVLPDSPPHHFLLLDAETAPSDPKWWEQFEKLFNFIGQTPRGVTKWDCNPERLSKLSLLEPKGKYPMSWLSCRLADDHFWAFKYGPRTAGVLVPLERAEIEEHHGVWLW